MKILSLVTMLFCVFPAWIDCASPEKTKPITFAPITKESALLARRKSASVSSASKLSWMSLPRQVSVDENPDRERTPLTAHSNPTPDLLGESELCVRAPFASEQDIHAILKKESDPNTRDPKNGMTALMCAAQAGNQDAVRALLQANADSTLRDNNGRTALDHARSLKDDSDVQVITGLLNKLTT